VRLIGLRSTEIFKDSRKMDLGALAWAERSNKIAKEIIIVQNGGVPPPPTVSVDHTMNGDISVDLWCCCFLDQTQSSPMG
jgi:hypothetical protein